jgi:sugar phosphate isomerase/epimerase
MNERKTIVDRQQTTAIAEGSIGAGSVTKSAAQGLPSHQAPPQPPFNLSLAEWSLHRTLFAGQLDHLDFPKVAKQDYGIDAIELVNQFFKDKVRDGKYLADFKKRADDLGVRILLIMCDNEGMLGDEDGTKRKEAVENHYKWADAAKFFGCHSIRVNATSIGSPEQQLELAADGLRRLSEYAAKLGLNVLLENHGALSSNAAWLVSLIRKAGLPNCGTLPDFGNWYGYDRYQGVTEMMPIAKAVSAKSNDFDATGNEIHTDYRRMVKIVLDAGYHGHLGIEYEGDTMSEPDGIRATKALLEKIRIEFTRPPQRPRIVS